jgi:PQQ-dependent catabolism-associated CXXCW motif protein
MAISRRFALLCLLLLTAAGPAPEPSDVWTGLPNGDVPETLRGGTVIHTQSLAELIAQKHPVLIDVVPAPRRPPSGVFLPPPHPAIPGTVWLPGIGWGKLSDEMALFLAFRLEELTGGDHARPLVFYCRPHCWLSWNAAFRAIQVGYSQVYWYPDGIESWQQTGLPTKPVRPEGPEAE